MFAHLHDYLNTPQTPTDHAMTERHLRIALSRRAPYTLLKRSLIRIPAIIALFD